ncbi:hypothetical protein [Agarivorans gilvus]|uniref:hypothetical protein n=1 Tax=Agarivorans gilvus TaxID=680279 RepID=UPI0006EBE1A3|nr:hypothetical protein [Agarivorans gilvus]
MTSEEAEHCLSVASCAGALGNKSRRMKIMQGELSFCFVFLFSQKKNDVAAGESFYDLKLMALPQGKITTNNSI